MFEQKYNHTTNADGKPHGSTPAKAPSSVRIHKIMKSSSRINQTKPRSATQRQKRAEESGVTTLSRKQQDTIGDKIVNQGTLMTKISNCGCVFKGCLIRHFTIPNKNPNWDSLFETVDDCVNRLRNKNKKEENEFLCERIRSAMVPMKVGCCKRQQFRFFLENLPGKQICRAAFAASYGVTVNRVNTLCAAVKKSLRPNASKGSKFTDYTIPNASFGEILEHYKSNVVFEDDNEDSNKHSMEINPSNSPQLLVGDDNGSITALTHGFFTDMVRATLTSAKSPMQAELVCWLKQYFNSCGDHIPNGDEIKLNMTRLEAYGDYLKYMNRPWRKHFSENNAESRYTLKRNKEAAADADQHDSSHLQDDDNVAGSGNMQVDGGGNNNISSFYDLEELEESDCDGKESEDGDDDKQKLAKTDTTQNRFVLSYRRFCEIWKTIFPDCVTRQYVDIPGKCTICYLIDEMRKSEEDSTVQKYLSVAHALHRGGMFMLERQQYFNRREVAAKSVTDPDPKSPKIMSVIIDIMDQNRCNIPYLGTQKSFGNPLNQIVVAIKEHGYGVTIYRVVETVGKSANLILYCFLKQLMNFKRRHQSYPDEIYVQVDGGSENANQYLLGMLELLIIKRVVKRILYTRLPTGHTHEEIDAIFGIIWKAFRNHVSLTFEDYRSIVLDAFKDNNITAEMEDVYIIPNYVSIIEDCIDPTLENLHKEPKTQHQWKFEYVERDPIYFPLGCKTTYRSYSSRVVIELRKLPQSQCRSLVGQYTGLEPYAHYSRWYPTAQCNPSRKIEGCYLLLKVPSFDYINYEFPPVDIQATSYASIEKMMSEVERFFSDPEYDYVRSSWRDWTRKYGPPSANSTGLDYLQKLRSENSDTADLYEVPLKEILCNPTNILKRRKKWDTIDTHAFLNSLDIEELPKELSAATNSVRTQFNPHPMPPRVYAIKDDNLRRIHDEFIRILQIYYQNLSKESVAILYYKVTRRMNFQGEVPQSGTVRADMIKKIRECDVSVVKRFHINLNETNKLYVMSELVSATTEYRPGMNGKNRQVAVKLGKDKKYEVYKNLILQLGSDYFFRIENDILKVIVFLFRERDRHLLHMAKEVAHCNIGQSSVPLQNSTIPNPKQRFYFPSIFVPPMSVEELIQMLATGNGEEVFLFDPLATNRRGVHRIYFLVSFSSNYNTSSSNNNLSPHDHSSVSNWIVIFIDIKQEENKMFYVNPKQLEGHGEIALSQIISRIGAALKTFLHRRFAVEVSPAISRWGEEQYFKKQQDDVNSVCFLYAILYYLVNDCPLYFQIPSNTQELRYSLIYNILSSQLPY